MDFLFYPGSIYNHISLILFPLSIIVQLTLIDNMEKLNFTERGKNKPSCIIGTEIMAMEEFLAHFYLSADSKRNRALADCFWLL